MLFSTKWLHSATRSRQVSRKARLSLEVVEERAVPTVVVTNQILTITPSESNLYAPTTTIVTVFNNHTPSNRFDDKIVVTQTTPSSTTTSSFPLYGGIIIVGKGPRLQITGIEFHGGAGDDVFKNMTKIPTTAYGGQGTDSLYAGSGGDMLIAGGGTDYLFGGAGPDVLKAGAGHDVLVSIGGGADTLYAGTGAANFWYDSKDVVHLPVEGAGQVTLHKVTAFYSYSYNGGSGHSPVSLQLKGQNLADPLPGIPGLQVTNFKDLPLFGPDGPQLSDIQQGDIGDCYFLSTLGAMAQTNPNSIRQMVVDLGDSTYAVQFHDTLGHAVYVRVDADLWTYSDQTPVFAGFGPENTLWVPIVEKAWAFYRDKLGNYTSIAGGNNPGINLDTALNLMQPVNIETASFANGQAYLSAIQDALAQGLAVTFGAPVSFNDNTLEASTTYRRGQHVYVVEAVLTDANGTPTGIQLYNPWGFEVTINNPSLIYYCSLGVGTFQV
jgi:hypothetical protein